MLHVGGQAEHMVVITVKPVHGARYAVRDLSVTLLGSVGYL